MAQPGLGKRFDQPDLVRGADRTRFDRCVEVFQDYCTVSGAVREGIEIRTTVVPPDTRAE